MASLTFSIFQVGVTWTHLLTQPHLRNMVRSVYSRLLTIYKTDMKHEYVMNHQQYVVLFRNYAQNNNFLFRKTVILCFTIDSSSWWFFNEPSKKIFTYTQNTV